jgi:ribose transport system ATP-binding protein
VFRNGRRISTFAAGSKTDAEVIELMIGREYKHVFPDKPGRKVDARPPALQCRSLGWNDRLRDISFSLHAGEIIGLGGLDGQGQRELLLALFGVLRGCRGDILIDGDKVRIESPVAAKSERIGLALIPEDRKTEGLMLPMSVRDNLSVAAFDRFARFGVIDRRRQSALIDEMIRLIEVKTASPDLAVSALSGGNQQKVVIAKWLMNKPRIILLNDPTRGIDVGTKQELYRLMRELADQGAAILFYSTDYDELIGCCDRVAIMYDGRIVRELEGDELTETNIIASSLNVDATTPANSAAGTTHA